MLELDKSQIRNIRIQTLTNMALRGATMDELLTSAKHWVSNQKANEYIDEVVSRLNK